jgi:glycosyltransferase involved in cell wall biosynthesis
MRHPTFSVAMPVHNGANYLRAALDSLLAQSSADFELVASDNASSDSTPEILADYAKRDSRFRCSRTEELLPVTENFNRAGSLAQGQWILFLSHDDLLKPTCFERLTAALANPESAKLALVGFGEAYLFSNGYVANASLAPSPPERLYPGRDFLRLTLTGRGPDPLPGMSNAAVRREVWERFGRFDPRFLHCDTFLWHRVLLDYDFLVIADTLVVRRIHEQQDSVSVRQQGRTIREFQTFFPEFLHEHQAVLGLPQRARALASRRYVSVAATEIVIQLAKRRPRRALAIMRFVPWRLYPLLAALVLRNARREAIRTREVRRHVPLNVLYPG